MSIACNDPHFGFYHNKVLFNMIDLNQRTNGPVNAHLNLLHKPINMFEYYGI